MKYLIVNADEFGLSSGVNKGIIEAFQNGIVRSTTLVVTGKCYDDAITFLRNNPELGAGVHLTLTGGIPVSNIDGVKSLVDEEGKLLLRKKFFRRMISGLIKLNEVEKEFDAQINKLINSGIKITHLDSHQSTYMYPSIFKIAVKMAKKYNLPMRFPIDPISLNKNISFNLKKSMHVFKKIVLKLISMKLYKEIKKSNIRIADSFRTYYDFHRTDGDFEKSLLNLLKSLDDGINEVMSHPGYWDKDLADWVNGKEDEGLREKELRALTSDGIKTYIRENNIILVNWGCEHK